MLREWAFNWFPLRATNCSLGVGISDKRPEASVADSSSKVVKGRSKPPPRRSVCFSRLDPEFVIYSDSQFLFTAQVPLSCLYRNVPEQKLNLIQFAAGEMA
jgi:hypothetical protein